jgi:hypothetical protein
MNTQTPITKSENVPPKRLWFGFSGAAMAWVLAGLADAVLAWIACIGGEAGFGVFTPVGMRILLGVITFGLLAIATAGGVVSFQNWQRLSESGSFVEAEARNRKQFMALTGVFISVVLGIGILWFSIPIYLLGICVRAK